MKMRVRIPCRGLLSPIKTISVTFYTSTKAFLKFFKLFSLFFKMNMASTPDVHRLYHKGNEKQIILIGVGLRLISVFQFHTQIFYLISILSLTTAGGIKKNQLNTSPENYKENCYILL